MRKRVAFSICLVIVLVMLSGIVAFSAGETSAETISLYGTFDKSGYASGETVAVEIKVDVPNSQADTKIGVYALHLEFDENVLNFVDGTVVEAAISGSVSGHNLGSEAGEAGSISILGEFDDDGETFTDNMLIAAINFTAKSPIKKTDGLLNFRRDEYDNTYGLDKENGYNSFDFGIIDEFKMANQAAAFLSAEGKVTATVDIELPLGGTGVMFVGLFDKTVGLSSPKYPMILKTIDGSSFGENTFTFEGVSSVDNLEVKYFLWEGVTSIRPLAEPQIANIQ